MSEPGDEVIDADKINQIAISNFKSSKLCHQDKRNRMEELDKIKQTGQDEPGSPTRYDAIRLPNQLQSQVRSIGDTKVALKSQVMMSPTNILSGGAKKMESFFN